MSFSLAYEKRPKKKKKSKKDKSLLLVAKRKGKTFRRCEVGHLIYLVTKGSHGRLLLLIQIGKIEHFYLSTGCEIEQCRKNTKGQAEHK